MVGLTVGADDGVDEGVDDRVGMDDGVDDGADVGRPIHFITLRLAVFISLLATTIASPDIATLASD